MNILVSNKSMEVVVNGIRRYVVIFLQVVQYRLFKVFWNVDYMVWFNKTPGRLHECALLGNDAIYWILRGT